MRNQERVLNVLFGLSLIYWGIAGFIFGKNEFELSIVRIFITLLNITVGLLFIFRKPVIKSGNYKAVLISLPSVICGGLLFKIAKPVNEWGTFTELLFLIGGIITISSFLFLGKNFAILPNLRKVVSKGPFQIIRHPAYLGETMLMTASLIAYENKFSFLLYLIFIPTLMARILIEEKLLNESLDYLIYQSTVKWRLIPFIW